MNSYDQAALRAIRTYHEKHGKYPATVEATAGYRSRMTCTHFECPEPPEPVDYTAFTSEASPTSRLICTRVPVLPLGSGDVVFHRLLVKNTNIDLEQAQCATYEEFHRVGAKLARKGLLILEPKERWGLQDEESYFSQIEAFIFGEEAVFEEMSANPSERE